MAWMLLGLGDSGKDYSPFWPMSGPCQHCTLCLLSPDPTMSTFLFVHHLFSTKHLQIQDFWAAVALKAEGHLYQLNNLLSAIPSGPVTQTPRCMAILRSFQMDTFSPSTEHLQTETEGFTVHNFQSTRPLIWNSNVLESYSYYINFISTSHLLFSYNTLPLRPPGLICSLAARSLLTWHLIRDVIFLSV